MVRVGVLCLAVTVACGGSPDGFEGVGNELETGGAAGALNVSSGGTAYGPSGGSGGAGQGSGGRAAGNGGAVATGGEKISSGGSVAAGGAVASGGASAGGSVSAGGSPESGGAPGSGGEGAGGATVDPLEPYPAPDCPGYTAYWIPEGGCLWVHGRFYVRTPDACDVASGGDLVHQCALVDAVREEGNVIYVQAEPGRAYAADRIGACDNRCVD